MRAAGNPIGIGETVAKLDGEELGATISSPTAGFVRTVLKNVGEVALAGEPLVIVAEPLPSGR
jgi:hypothetical protein